MPHPPQYDGIPVDLIIRADMGTFNEIRIFTPASLPGNTPIKLPGNPMNSPGAPFVLTDVIITNIQNGTSCSNPAKWNVTPVYTGDPTGKTVDFYTNNSSRGYQLYIDSESPDTHVINQQAWFNKPNSVRTIQVKVQETSDAGNFAISEERSIEGTDCGV